MNLISHIDFECFRNGDQKIFEQIFHRYYKTLLSFAIRHDIGEMDAEDIVIDVFHRIWTMRRDIKSSAALHSLLYMSVRNQTLNFLRNTNNRMRILEQQEIEQVYDLQNLIIEEEMSRILDDAISKLSPGNQFVIRASLEGKTLAQIAEEMNISINTVKTHRLRAITALRKSLKHYPYLLILFYHILK
ncbi:MAG: sigma-70 family RNA polymerase sigma factor [Bacteroidia bacterium]|nr:sigma-70 family RNA polymerase sigma factor [Bacteroidia bacterium]